MSQEIGAKDQGKRIRGAEYDNERMPVRFKKKGSRFLGERKIEIELKWVKGVK